MAHNIETRGGKSSIVYAGATPWHQLGQKVEDAFDAATALKQGGLDFTVQKVPVCTADNQVLIPDRFALRRQDTGDVLGMVTDFYQPLQNREAFAFFDGVFGKDLAKYEVAGVLGKGEQVWLLAKLPGDFRVQGDDVMGKYLLLTNGHNGNEPVRARFTPIRVVCQNTLNAALRGGQSEVRVQHIGKVADKLEVAGKLLKAAGLYFNDVETMFRGFIRRDLTQKVLTNYVTRSVTGELQKLDDLTKPARRTVDRILELHETGRGSDLKGVRGTLWGAYNAVTEHIDHDRTAKGLAYMAVGRGAEIKQRAFSVAQDMILNAANN